ncbi:MAG TPA: GNAT family protein [Geminicoccaceae bacterium]
MDQPTNHLGQPIGFPVPGWQRRPPPPRTALEGRWTRLEPLDPDRHAGDLFEAYAADREGRIWTYLPYGPFEDEAGLRDWIARFALGDDPLFHAILERRSGRALGVASLMRIEPAVGVIEVGHINYAPALQRTPMATEAMFLLMRRVFDELGYRRYEWKCDDLNAPSKRAAERLGFTYEGRFRQATMYKGRNRDTAWFSILDREWPALEVAYAAWLDPANFDDQGRQREALSALIARARPG